jgi:DNA polymerase
VAANQSDSADEGNVPLQRILLQHLEAWQRAGLTHLGRPASPASAPVAVAVAGVANALSAPAGPAPPVASSPPEPPLRLQMETAPPVAKRSTPSKTTLLPLESAGPACPEAAPSAPAAAPATAGKPLSREERQQQLDIVRQRVAVCTRCQELAETRTQTVFGVGNPEARVMFIGEAPGADEDLQGEPFVGRAGQLLNRIIEAAKMKREDIYICNILRCRPPGNRTPSPVEAANCREYLDAQISIVDPEYIVCWGSCAAQNLLGATDSIGKMRRRFYQYGRAKVLCTYHPSYLLRNPAAKKDVWEDIQLLMAELGIPVDKPA